MVVHLVLFIGAVTSLCDLDLPNIQRMECPGSESSTLVRWLQVGYETLEHYQAQAVEFLEDSQGNEIVVIFGEICDDQDVARCLLGMVTLS